MEKGHRNMSQYLLSTHSLPDVIGKAFVELGSLSLHHELAFNSPVL